MGHSDWDHSDCWYKDVCQYDCSNPCCIRYDEMKYLMDHSNIPKNRQKPVILQAPKCDYDAYCTLADIKDNITTYVGLSDIYICSNITGNGKTSWAIKLMLKYFDQVWAGNGFRTRGLFVHVPTFLLKCKDFKNIDPDFVTFKEQLFNVDLVIWDDIASTDISAYDYSQLLMYIDTRVNECRTNIFTGNLTSRESLQKALGDKLTSRIWNNSTIKVVFKGGDKR